MHKYNMSSPLKQDRIKNSSNKLFKPVNHPCEPQFDWASLYKPQCNGLPQQFIIDPKSILDVCSRHEILILDLLLSFKRRCKFIFPTQETIANTIGSCRERVNIAIRSLTENGFISKVYRHLHSNVYFINDIFNDFKVRLALQSILPALKDMPFFLALVFPFGNQWAQDNRIVSRHLFAYVTHIRFNRNNNILRWLEYTARTPYGAGTPPPGCPEMVACQNILVLRQQKWNWKEDFHTHCHLLDSQQPNFAQLAQDQYWDNGYQKHMPSDNCSVSPYTSADLNSIFSIVSTNTNTDHKESMKHSLLIEQLTQSLQLSRWGQLHLSVYPEESLRFAMKQLSYSKHIKNKIAFFVKKAKEYCLDNNLKIDWAKSKQLQEDNGIQYGESFVVEQPQKNIGAPTSATDNGIGKKWDGYSDKEFTVAPAIQRMLDNMTQEQRIANFERGKQFLKGTSLDAEFLETIKNPYVQSDTVTAAAENLSVTECHDVVADLLKPLPIPIVEAIERKHVVSVDDLSMFEHVIAQVQQHKSDPFHPIHDHWNDLVQQYPSLGVLNIVI